MKNPLIPAGIEPVTFRLVEQHLSHCATAVPQSQSRGLQNMNHQSRKNYQLSGLQIMQNNNDHYTHTHTHTHTHTYIYIYIYPPQLTLQFHRINM